MLASLIAVAFVLCVALGASVVGDGLMNAEATAVAAIPWYYRLYTNNHTPTNADTTASYTEATFTGYTAFGPVTGFPGGVVGDSNTIDYGSAVAQWTSGGGSPPNDTIYGVYITDVTGNVFYGANLFAGGPFDMTVNGAILTLTTANEVLTRV